MPARPETITVSLNPAVDRVIEVDELLPGEHVVGRELRRTPGGKGVNVSRVLAATGSASAATGFLGEENRAIFDPLFAAGVIRDEFIRLPGRTRENVTIAERGRPRETHIRDAGLAVEPEQVDQLRRKLVGLISPGAIVVFGGSMPPGIDADGFVRLVNACRGAGARVAVDTSGEPLRAACGRGCWLVKPNTLELSQIARRELTSEADELAAARRLARDVEIVLHSRGRDGADLFGCETALRAAVTVKPQQLRNTVGCGDVLLGVFIAGVRDGAAPDNALRDAVAAAAAAACSVTTADFEKTVFERLRERVRLEEIEMPKES